MFSAISPFLPRLISTLDVQPTFLLLVLLDIIIFGWRLREKVVYSMILFGFIFIASALWNFEYLHDFYLTQSINSIAFILTILYFYTYIREYSHVISKNLSYVFIYMTVISSLYLLTNGSIERSLFTQREFLDIDLSRGISPLSPEPAAFAKILWSLILISILLNVPRRAVYISISLILLMLNASGAAIVAIFSTLIYLIKLDLKNILFSTAVGLLLSFFFIIFLESLYNLRGFDLFLGVLNSGSLDAIFIDQSFSNRITSFNFAWSHFLDNLLFGSFFTFEVMGGLVSLVGQLGIVVLCSFALIVIKIFKTHGRKSFLFLVFLSVLFISDSFTIPLYSFVLALLITPISYDDLLNYTA